jgi:hypothetical protein
MRKGIEGIKPHTPWDDLVEIISDIHEKGADLILTLRLGSLADGVKVIIFVSPPSLKTCSSLRKIGASE